MSKPWADMSREELLVEKNAWEARLQQTNLDMRTAKRRAAADRVFLPVEEMEGMEQRRLRLISGLRKLQFEIGKRNSSVPAPRSYEWYFHDEADAVLDDDQYNLIHDRARARMLNEGRSG